MEELKGKSFLVVGGSSGIGKQVVAKLLNLGADVINASRTESDVENVKNVSLDVTSDFKEIANIPDRLDGLVYCPGSINLKPFQSLKPEDFQKDFEINVLGGVKTVKSVLKNLRAAEGASIVFFSTVAVSQGMNFHASVAAAKGAVEGLTRSLAAEFSGKNIRVNAIAPSLTDTPMAANLLSSEDKRKASIDRHPLKKVGSTQEMADSVAYLLSSGAGWMTGQILHIDGGMSSVRPL